MKWRLHITANILNIAAICGAFFLLIRNLYTQGFNGDLDFFLVFVIAGITLFAKGLMAIDFQKKIQAKDVFSIKGGSFFHILIVLHIPAALLCCYTTYDMLHMIKNRINNSNYIYLFITIALFSLTSLVIIPLDYVMLANLKKLEDPSLGILEENSSDNVQ